MPPPTNNYEIPYYGSPASTLHGWCLEAQQEGLAWLNVQRPTRAWAGVIEMLSAVEGGDEVEGLSNTGYNKGKRIARELVATLGNFRHEGETKVTWDQSLYDQAHVLTQLDRNLYRQPQIPRGFRSALQYAVGKGTAYLWERWNPSLHSPHRGDIELVALDPGDVTFVQLPRDFDIQRAYAVIIREELPLNLAKAMYRGTNAVFAASLTPDRESPGWLAKGLQKVQRFVAPALRVAGRIGGQSDQASFPTVDIFHMYTLDSTLNEGPFAIPMGPRSASGGPAANWAYDVPALGDPLPTGLINPATGNEFTTPAEWTDTRMFPFRRYTIFSRTGIAYDGPATNWHGACPVARLRFNDWPWEALGATLVGEVRTMQKGIEALMRAIEDSAAGRLNPARIYDDTLVAESWAKAFNPRMAGAVAAAPLSQGKVIEFPLGAEYYNVPTWIPEWIRSQEDRMDYITSVRDLVAMAKAQQIPSADTIEKLFEMAGPIVQDLVRQVEEPLLQLGSWRIASYFQFYTRERMITITGEDGVDVDTLYKPDSLRIPAPKNAAVSPTGDRRRAIKSLDEFKYEVTESGVNEIHRMSTKLFYLQLMKEGFPISPWTFARIAQIPNFGPEPKGTNTEMERWMAWRRMEIELEAELQAEQAIRMQEIAAAGIGQPTDGGTPQSGNGGRPGRPQSYQKPPKLEQKDGGARTTVTTS
jgi:hypothetical protein